VSGPYNQPNTAVLRSRSAGARQLLDSPAVRDLLEEIRGELHQDWETATTTDRRELLWYQLCGLDALVNRISDYASAFKHEEEA